MEAMDTENPNKRPQTNSEPPTTVAPRPKRSKTAKACNACRKQKSRCERLSGDSEGCHRCGVIGIPCVFDSDGFTSDSKARKPRPILPRNRLADERSISRSSPDSSGLHVLANTTEMLSRQGRHPVSPAANNVATPSARATTTNNQNLSTSKTCLSAETLSTVESALFPVQPRGTSETNMASFRADWRRWVAPLTLLQTLVRRNRVPSPSLQRNLPTEPKLLNPAEEKRLKNHFQTRYSPWLPAVKLGQHGTLDDISPFLTTVIYATAARTLGAISQPAMEHLRALSLHHVGQVFASPAAYPLVDSLYALLILVLWPLDAADDVALLVHGAKRLANSSERGTFMAPNGSSQSDHTHTTQNGRKSVDHIRLWYAICANETILTLGAGSITTSPAVDDLINAFGSASELALKDGCTPDVLIVLQTNLHSIVVAAIGERGFSDKSSPCIPKGQEAVLNYISTVYMFLTKLGEWEIEFCTISSDCRESEAAYYAVLGIEYHYLSLIFATHSLLTLCHACPLESASQEVKTALWSWSITSIKSAHSLIRLFNTYSEAHTSTSRNAPDGTHLPPLALAPDRIFAMVVLAVMLVLRHQVASYEFGLRRGLMESPPAGFTKQAERAIRKAIEHMGNIGHMTEDGSSGAAVNDHAASRYVDILEALFRIWEKKRALQREANVAEPNGYMSAEYAEQPLHGWGQRVPTQTSGEVQGGETEPVQLDLDLSVLGTDLFSDTAAAFTWDGVGTLDWGSAVHGRF